MHTPQLSCPVVLQVIDKPVIVFENDFLALTHFVSRCLLVLKWKRQINFEERVEGFREAYSYSCRNAVQNWFINEEEIFLITPQEKQWVAHTWTKMLADTQIQKIAVFTTASYNVLIAHTEFALKAQEIYKRFGKTEQEVFTEMNSALVWLEN